ncbi:DUF2251 domain-containing protein [Mucilaginibacter flavidus]|uniref:DUF2251 domain-containing protein n=1 Tax=Mucilaginibacter flavidus TaxID=2949309 RepID=UPI002093DBDB|nr:DUF2251 domain-containing protein [Mucilaginibacter flavidus]MCO5945659.1 DUF2251 domain-containing protein [Mucilaginibacter flavidus]
MILDLEETFTVGEDTFFSSISPTSPFAVVFEDDLTTGYFYALNNRKSQKILDAVHIYNVANVVDKHKPSLIQIIWTDDGQIASLMINHYCHAMFDFQNKSGYCRNAFPDSNGEWAQTDSRKLTDELIAKLLNEH